MPDPTTPPVVADRDVPVIVHPPAYSDAEGYQPGGLECPHCGALNMIEETDVSLRTNTFSVEAHDDGTPRIIGHKGTESGFDSDSVECQSCGRAVCLDGMVHDWDC